MVLAKEKEIRVELGGLSDPKSPRVRVMDRRRDLMNQILFVNDALRIYSN